MDITFENCLVFNHCVQNVAGAQLTVAAINNISGRNIMVDAGGSPRLITGGKEIAVQFEVCCRLDRVTFSPTLLRNKIINCGWVSGSLLIKNIGADNVLDCIEVTLTFQQELAANGVLPGDLIRETAEVDEGTDTFLALRLNPDTGAVEPVVFMKWVFSETMVVTRNQVSLPSNCNTQSLGSTPAGPPGNVIKIPR
ncbi:hypothetical protein [Desulfocucumis palustris]|nr:hypothetical protein [Desulfocucumis palustris]